MRKYLTAVVSVKATCRHVVNTLKDEQTYDCPPAVVRQQSLEVDSVESRGRAGRSPALQSAVAVVACSAAAALET